MARALKHTFGDGTDEEIEDDAWEQVARKVIQVLRETPYDVIQSNYCNGCPVRQRVSESAHGRNRSWFLDGHRHRPDSGHRPSH
jgi:hypothetical protein